VRLVARDLIRFSWRGWRRFAYDFLVIQIGFLLFGLSIDIMVRANLGLSSWDVLHMALTYHLPISLGEASVGVAFVVVLVDVILREPLGWGTIMNMLFIGTWIDVLKPFVPAVPSVLWVQLVYLMLGTLLMGFGTAIYIGVDAGAGPRDSLMLALSRIGNVSLRWSRTLLESATVLVGWLLGGPFWVGTIISAIAIGPSVQLAFRILKVRTSDSQRPLARTQV
jgi:uncharacterized membrane protein YczE